MTLQGSSPNLARSGSACPRDGTRTRRRAGSPPLRWARYGGSFAALALLLVATDAAAQSAPTPPDPIVFGFRLRGGGRYDDVRLCAATGAGVKGGPAADISLFAELPLRSGLGLDIDLPAFRPILFASRFDMVQFEPTASLRFRQRYSGGTDLIVGPTAGVTVHHGPDYRSELTGPGRTPSFWALGPIIGGYVGADFKRDARRFNAQLGVTPYFSPLFGVNDPEHHRGVVIGGLLDGSFRFRVD